MDPIDLKRKLRKLKQLEKTIRTQNNIKNDVPLVWGKFFDLHDTPNKKALYTLSQLSTMSKEEYKEIADDFIARIYYEVYAHNGLIQSIIYDTTLLAQLGLPPIADEIAIKRRFRELVKEHHPDVGGDHKKFVALMEIYKELIGVKKTIHADFK